MTNSTTPLWQWSACELAEALLNRKISAVETVSSALERMHATNSHLNAVVDDLSESALRQAEAHDRDIVQGNPIGPLHGVPITIKQNVDQKGLATTHGLEALKDFIAPDDSAVVRNLLNAGAIVIGRTNTPEFSFRGTTVNELYGRTYNPWNDTAAAGGSSGGAAASVMEGYGPIAHGNDIGGSLRCPAYACGAVTVKPGLGRVPTYDPTATTELGLLGQLMCAQGVICREVRDVRLAMQSLIQPDVRDPWHVAAPLQGPTEPGPIRVAFTKSTFDFELHPSVDKALETAKAALETAGYLVETVEPPPLVEAAEMGLRCLLGELRATNEAQIRQFGSATVNAIFEEYYRQFPPFEGVDLLNAMADRNRITRAWTMFLADYPLVLMPFLPNPIYSWDRDEQGPEGVREVVGSSLYSYSINFVGLPAGIVPANGKPDIPVGVQLVGRRFREDMILDACEAVENQVGVMAHRLWARNNN